MSQQNKPLILQSGPWTAHLSESDIASIVVYPKKEYTGNVECIRIFNPFELGNSTTIVTLKNEAVSLKCAKCKKVIYSNASVYECKNCTNFTVCEMCVDIFKTHAQGHNFRKVTIGHDYVSYNGILYEETLNQATKRFTYKKVDLTTTSTTTLPPTETNTSAESTDSTRKRKAETIDERNVKAKN